MALYKIQFSDRAQLEDLPRLDAFVRIEIASAIEKKLETTPEMFGKPLRHTMRLMRVLRVGDWRVVFTITGVTVYILTVRHRKKGYADLT